MYVCNCAGVTERDIQAAIARGAVSVKDLRRELNVANDCCLCTCDVKRYLREHKAMIEQVDLQAGNARALSTPSVTQQSSGLVAA